MLGLQRSGQWRGDGVYVSEIDPVLPFWYQVDMIYERGVNVAWRSFDTLWHDQDGHVYPPTPAGRGTGPARPSPTPRSSGTRPPPRCRR